MINKIRIGVIGCGLWGPNQIRTFFFHPEVQVLRVCDRDINKLEAIKVIYPTISTSLDYRDITEANDIDAVIIVTPVSTHYEMVKSALYFGKDVLCEKPLTLKSVEAIELRNIADARKRILMVGHVFLFNEGILALKRLINSEELGDICYLHAERTNLGPVRTDTNSVYDLASHDISIFNYLLGPYPEVISVTGKGYLKTGVEDVAFISLEYTHKVLAQIHVSWLDPKKVRRITLVGTKKMVVWDDLSVNGPIEIYSPEGVFIPKIEVLEPLKQQANHFIKCIIERTEPISDATNAVQVIEVLEEIDKNLQKYRDFQIKE